MKRPIIPAITLILTFLIAAPATAQQPTNIQLPTSINTDGSDPDASAILDVQATNKGMLVPRMTSIQRKDIPSPATGLLVFDTDKDSFWFYNGANWQNLTDEQTLTFDSTSNELSIHNGNTVDLTALVNKAGDYSQYFDFPCTAPQDFNINTHKKSGDDCGNLYDSGGPNGDYGSKERDTFLITRRAGSIYTRLLLQSLDMEVNDTLFIGDMVFTNDVAGPDTFYLDGRETVEIRFVSGLLNNAAGFHIFWDRMQYQGANSTNPNMVGFFFNAEKQAIGGGIEFDSAWSKIGHRSVLLGFGGNANGGKSTSVGYFNSASGDFSSAFGFLNEASDSSSAFGFNNEAAGSWSSAFGLSNAATGFRSSALGYSNDAVAERSSAFGYSNNAVGERSSAFGMGNAASELGSSAFGFFNDANGERSSAFGMGNAASELGSSAFGFSNDANGERSSVFGVDNQADGLESSAFGCFNEATGAFSNAFGLANATTGIFSNAFGYFNNATATYSHAIGYGTLSDVYGCMAIGSWNADPSGSAVSWVETDPVFVIGNGEGPFRSTAVTVLKNGNVGIGGVSLTDKLRVNGKVRIGSGEILEDIGTFQLSTNSNFFPTQDNLRSLGNSSHRWTAVWAVDGTINTSDRRDKTHIQDLPYGLAEVLRLRPVTYQWKDSRDNATKLGLIAQDLLGVLPEVVKTHDWEQVSEEADAAWEKQELERIGVYYSDIIPVLIKATQEQEEQAAQYRERIGVLEKQVGEIKQLKQQLAIIKQQLLSLSEKP